MNTLTVAQLQHALATLIRHGDITPDTLIVLSKDAELNEVRLALYAEVLNPDDIIEFSNFDFEPDAEKKYLLIV